MPEVIRLEDAASGAVALVAPGLGCNCFRFMAPHQGREIETLWAAADFAAGTQRPSGSGIPLLFPFPGRIRGTHFPWEGKDYPLEEGDGCGNAIHGFVFKRAWRVVEQLPRKMTAEFQASVDDRSLLARWPADFLIRATYEVAGTTLRGVYHISNPDTRPLPFGFGTHAYFRVPLGGASAEKCLIKAPVTEAWELENMHATGQRVPLANANQFAAGLPFGAAKFDNVFTGLKFSGERFESRVMDPESGIEVTQSFDRNFPHCVMYTPPHRQAICVEPYTCVPDAFRLARAGIAAGARVLAPGEILETTIEITLGEAK